VPRTIKPEDALTVRYPSVAATWHPNQNGAWTPENTTCKNSYVAWWQCAAGHEGQETVAARTAMPAWKKGNPAACRVCVGYHVIVTFDCGHTTEARAQFAEPERGCPDCRKVRWAARQEQLDGQRRLNSAIGKKLYRECTGRARALVDSLESPDVPPLLATEWRRAAAHAVQMAIVAEEGFHRAGAIEAALDRQRRASKALLPTREALHAAIGAREPVTVVGRAHWPLGWLHHLNIGDGGRPAHGASLVDELRDVLVTEVGTLPDLLGPDRHLTKARVTAALTASIVEWTRGKRTSDTADWTALPGAFAARGPRREYAVRPPRRDRDAPGRPGPGG
jgi:hypothetical protein